MHNATHFVGFRDSREFANAVKAMGRPDFVHRFWDSRAVAEVFPGDTVVFAGKTTEDCVHTWTFDDSAMQ